MDTNFEQIIPWNGANDTGKDVRLKWQRNFERIKANFEELSDLFEKVNLGTDEAPAWAIRAKYGLYTDSWLSAKGKNPDSSTAVAGATELSKLTDVLITDLKDGQGLYFDLAIGKWVNRDAVAGGGLDETKLAEYLTTHQYTTQEWITQQGYATQQWASGQFALRTVAINAGTGLTGGGTLTASRTLSLAQVGTAGTYTKVTVDAYGRVTKGTTLAAADIPTLSISKISGLQAALDDKLDADDFEELFEKVYVSGYGYAIRAKLALYTDEWLSAKGVNSDAGGTVVAGASSWDEIEGKPSTLAGYGIQTEADERYVNVSGDTMTGSLNITNGRLTVESNNTDVISLTAKNTSVYGALIGFRNNSGELGYIGIGGSKSTYPLQPIFQNKVNETSHKIWHAGNDGSGSGLDADLLDGKHYSDIINGNVASATVATRLQTARTLWGQSFNGTANVSGKLSGVSGISFTADECATMDDNGNIYLDGLTSSTAFWFVGIPASTKRLVVKANGYVGIGTTNPEHTLHVEGGLCTSSYVQVGSARLKYDSSTGALYVEKADGTACGFYATGFMSSKGANADAGGAVAGGGSGEVHLMDIVDMVDAWKLIVANYPVDYVLRWPSWSEVTGKPSTFTPASHTHTLAQISDLHSSWDSYLKSAPAFATTSSNVASATRLQTARTLWGQSFNGTANVSGKLSGVSGISFTADECATMDGNGNIYLDGLTSSTAFWFVGIPASTKRLVVKANGYVGIGTTNPSYPLHVSGSAYASGGFQNGSDIRYKHILADLPLTPAQVAAAPAFLFRWKDGEDKSVHAGTSAQYWRTVLPQAVMEGGDGRLSMQYGVAALLSAVAVARSVIDHEERLKKLEAAVKVAV